MVRVEKSELHTIGEQCLKDMRTIGEYNGPSVTVLYILPHTLCIIVLYTIYTYILCIYYCV